MRYAEVTDMKRFFGGTLTLKNGRIDKYQFDEGYCQAEKYIYNTSHMPQGQETGILVEEGRCKR